MLGWLSHQQSAPVDLSSVRLGPQTISGQIVVMRQPRFDDFAEWRRIRLRDQQLIEPFWVTSPLDWVSRHSERLWAREWLAKRDSARSGRHLSLVIEVDGRFAGQFDLGSIDPATRSAELGIWVDANVARRGVGGLAVTMVLDFGFETLGLERITAPISPENLAASHGAASVGLVREALMAEYFDVGGQRKDHALWAATRDAIPPKGFAHNWIKRFEAAHGGTEPAVAPRPQPHSPTGESRTLPPRALVKATCRYRAGKLRHQLDWFGVGRPVQLTHPGSPAVVLRTRRLSDYTVWQEVPRRQAAAPGQRRGRYRRVQLIRQFIAEHRGFRAAGELWLVIEIEGKLAGECWFSELDMFERNASVHMWVDSALAARCVATTATRQLLDYAFGQLGLVRVSMAIPAENTAAADAAARAGMVREGTMHNFLGPDGHRGDHDLWAATARMAANR